MKNYTLDKMGNHIPSIGKPDKMGNLPKYSEDTIRKDAHKGKPVERTVKEHLQEATKLMKC